MVSVVFQKNDTGVDTHSSLPQLDPRQQRFVELYLSPDSKHFGNCYQSAIKAGFTDMTARNLTHNRPKWLSETIGQSRVMEPELLVLKLGDIINNPIETTANKLKAIDMLMKHNNMYGFTTQNNVLLNIESVIG